MLKQITVQNESGYTLNLPLNMTARSFLLEKVDGIDPVKATLVSSDFAQLDGSQWQASRRDTRHITLRLNMVPDYVSNTARDLRMRLYGFFMPKSKVRLTFIDSGGMTCWIEGRVETFETPIFSAETTVDVGITCFDPDFRETSPMMFLGTSSTSSSNAVHLNYTGTVETGVKLTMSPQSQLSEFRILISSSMSTDRPMVFQNPIEAGDVLTIDTNPGQKSVMLKRLSNGLTSSALYGVSPESQWATLYPGDNAITVATVGGTASYTMEYTVKHGGL